MTMELKGWHVLAGLLAFFGITLAVNIALTVYAIDTFSGEDVAKPYLRGLEYNRTLESRAAQVARGWTATIDATRDGAAAALAVEATLRRPTDAALDRTIELTAVGGGEYRAAAEGLAPGAWDIIVRVKEDGAVFEAERRIVLK
jgi:nitrogen fixation protein FixH